MTVLQNGQHVPVQPRPEFGLSADFDELVVERARQMLARPNQPATREQIRDSFLAPEPQSVKHGYTDKHGRPLDVDEHFAKKARAQAAQEQAERRAELGF